jgi:hypothetical protein
MSIKDTVSLTNIERAIKAAQALHDAELKEALADTKLDLVQAKNLIADLKEEVQELKEKSKTKDELKFANESYWVVDKEGNRTDGPFCMSCFDVDKRKQRLAKGNSGYYVCPACKNSFLVDKKEYDTDVAEAQRNNSNYPWFNI